MFKKIVIGLIGLLVIPTSAIASNACQHLFEKENKPTSLLERSNEAYEELVLKKEELVMPLLKEFRPHWIKISHINAIKSIKVSFKEDKINKDEAVKRIVEILNIPEVKEKLVLSNEQVAVKISEQILTGKYKIESVLLSVTNGFTIRDFAETFQGSYLGKTQPNSKFFIQRDLSSFTSYFRMFETFRKPHMRIYTKFTTTKEVKTALAKREARLVERVFKMFAPLTKEDIFQAIEKVDLSTFDVVDADKPAIQVVLQKIMKSSMAKDFMASQGQRDVEYQIKQLLQNISTTHMTEYEAAWRLNNLIRTDIASVQYTGKEIGTIETIKSDLFGVIPNWID